MKKSDIEYLVVEIAENIYKNNADRFNEINTPEQMVDFMRYEREQVVTETISAFMDIYGDKK